MLLTRDDVPVKRFDDVRHPDEQMIVRQYRGRPLHRSVDIDQRHNMASASGGNRFMKAAE